MLTQKEPVCHFRNSFFPHLSFLFAFVAAFTFFALKIPTTSSAASLDNFSAGNIISDYVMSNYSSMSVEEIQSFLSQKGNCNDTETYRASWYPNLHYHIENGHFVCLANERFAKEGSNYGDLLGDNEPSQTAAEIIYEVAQEYRINPQVLIVLLQKEQGLITDSWPNSLQYRSATGFGCPDTAACDSKYYGLKNQLSSAANLFRSVLDGGWTNYPLGWNYIRYNPDSACGGSDVYVENLATSSLYRYTPYQPNQGALDAGYGTAYCGAYGNRNFYLYFMDYFGDPRYVNERELQEKKASEKALEDITAIYESYNSASGVLGSPKTGLLTNPNSGIRWQEYDNGFIVGNESHGYHISMGKIRDVWVDQKWEFGPLGFPQSEILTTEEGIEYQEYENNYIVYGFKDTGNYTYVPRAIFDLYRSYNSASGVLGSPKTGLLTNPNSGIRWQEYDNGFIVGNESHGYHISMGKIRDVWVDQKWEFGPLGFPQSEILTTEEGIEYQEYQGGRIYLEPNGATILESR